jgi:hypothetical protein
MPDKDAVACARTLVRRTGQFRPLWLGGRSASVVEVARGGGRRPQAGVGVPAASGSRSWCRRRGGTARRWRPARGRWPGRRRAAPRTAAAVPRSAGPGRVMPSPHRDRLANHVRVRIGNATDCDRTGRRGTEATEQIVVTKVRRAADGQQPTVVGTNTSTDEL